MRRALLFAAPGVVLLGAAFWWPGWPGTVACVGAFAWTIALVAAGIRDERAFWRDLADDAGPPADAP